MRALVIMLSLSLAACVGQIDGMGGGGGSGGDDGK